VTPSLQPLVPELDAPIDLPNDLGYARFRIKESSTTDNLCASVLDIRTPFQIGKYYNVLLPPPNPSWTGAMEFWKSRGGGALAEGVASQPFLGFIHATVQYSMLDLLVGLQTPSRA
jgi:hypothetical protein